MVFGHDLKPVLLGSFDHFDNLTPIGEIGIHVCKKFAIIIPLKHKLHVVLNSFRLAFLLVGNEFPKLYVLTTVYNDKVVKVDLGIDMISWFVLQHN